MTLLVDTDAFCKLGIAQLLEDAVGVLGVQLCECARLPALSYMLRRGPLVRRYGPQVCNDLRTVADEMGIVSTHDAELFAGIEHIDPGEAQLFATAIEADDCKVITGDKRAIRALQGLQSVHAVLAERIVTQEAILYTLCQQRGIDQVRQRVASVAAYDTVISACFSEGEPDPRVGLQSYFNHLVDQVQPLALWNPWNPTA